MKNYEFEYDDDKLKIKIFLISFLLFPILFFGLMFLNIFNFFLLISVSLGIPALIIQLNIKKIKKKGFAEIENEKIVINLNGVEKEIKFKEIDNYFINSYTGSSISLKLKNGKRYGVISNRYFSNPIRFTQVCHIFETEYEKYKKVNNIHSDERRTTQKTSSRETLEEENKRLRKELAIVKQEREILKKATAYFAKETL